MATVSFNKATKLTETDNSVKGPDLPIQTANSAPASTALATLANNAQIQGEFTARDMAIPYLSIGQKSGTLCDENPGWIGQWIYDRGLPLGNEIHVIFCRMKKRYEEVLEFGSPEIPQQFETEAAARAANVEFRDVAELDLLVECEEALAEMAMVEAGDACYAPARFVVRSSAYGKTVGILLKDLAGWLKNDLASGSYKMVTEKKTGNGNSWFAPKLSTAGKVSPELRKAIADTLHV